MSRSPLDRGADQCLSLTLPLHAVLKIIQVCLACSFERGGEEGKSKFISMLIVLVVGDLTVIRKSDCLTD